MNNQTAVGVKANTEFGSRVFVYEVEGLRQKTRTDNMNYPIRQSGTVFITVSYDRMNQEMQRISRMGGRIVSIKPLNGEPEPNGQVQQTGEKK